MFTNEEYYITLMEEEMRVKITGTDFGRLKMKKCVKYKTLPAVS